MDFDQMDPSQQFMAQPQVQPQVPFNPDQAQALMDKGFLSPDTYTKLMPQEASVPSAPMPSPAPDLSQAPQPIPVSQPGMAQTMPQPIPNAGQAPVALPVDYSAKDQPQSIPLAVSPVLDPVSKSIQDQQDAILNAAKVGEAKGAEQAAAYSNADRLIQKQNAQSLAKQADLQKQVDQQMTKVKQLTDDANSDKIDPNRYWADKTTGQKILAGISLFLGAFGRNGNDALRIINDSIDKDIMSQKMAIQGKKDSLGEQQNLLGYMKGQIKDEQLATQAAKVAALDNAQMQVNQIASKYSGQETQQKAQLLVSQLDAQKGAIQQDMMRRVAFNQAMQSDQAGQINPEMLDEKQRERFVPGFGLALTKDDASKMKETVGDVMDSKQSIDRLLQISNAPLKSVTPELRAEAQTLATVLQGKLRRSIVGGGNFSETEQQLMKDIIANPTAVFSWDSTNKKRLDTLKNKLDQGLASQARSIGLRVPQTVQQRVGFKPDGE